MSKKQLFRQSNNQTVAEIFERFVASQTAKGVSDKTIQNYYSHLHSLQKHLDFSAPLATLTKEDLDNMVISMRQSGLAHNSISSYLRVFRTFLNWARKAGYKQSLYQDWKDGEITQQEYRDMKADYERQTSDISAVLTRLNAERAELANGVDNEHPALVAFMKYQNIEALNREILVELVDYIKVYENGNISVKFKFADELRKIAEYIEINTTEDTAVAG